VPVDAGTYSVSASFTSDIANSNYTGAVGSGSITINNTSTTTSLSSSVNSPFLNQAVTFQATVSAVASGTVSPTGSISFYDGLALLGTKSLSSNSASLTLATLGVGSHSITAKYSGDSNFKGSTSNTVIQVVGYKVCLLYDPLKNPTKAGSTLPIKLYLCDTNNKNVSSSTLSVMALYVDGSPIPIKNSRNTNPNDLFRFVAVKSQIFCKSAPG